MARAPLTFLVNAQPTLRAVFVWLDDKTGNADSIDASIIGWTLNEATPPTPIVVGGAPKQAQLCAIRDEHASSWTTLDGRTFKHWKDLVAPLFAEYERTHQQPKMETDWPMDAPARTTRPVAGQREPVIGGLSGGMAPPQAWKPGK